MFWKLDYDGAEYFLARHEGEAATEIFRSADFDEALAETTKLQAQLASATKRPAAASYWLACRRSA